MNVLVVDGSELIRNRLAERIRAIAGVGSVATADSVRQGYQYLRSGLFDLAIFDLHLPDGTSSSIAESLKHSHKHLRVVIYSNDADDVNRRLCQKAGVEWFFDKSLEFDQIVSTASELACAHANTSAFPSLPATITPRAFPAH